MKFETGFLWIAAALLFIIFAGEPDIHDAIIHALGLVPELREGIE